MTKPSGCLKRDGATVLTSAGVGPRLSRGELGHLAEVVCVVPPTAGHLPTHQQATQGSPRSALGRSIKNSSRDRVSFVKLSRLGEGLLPHSFVFHTSIDWGRLFYTFLV